MASVGLDIKYLTTGGKDMSKVLQKMMTGGRELCLEM